MKQKETIIFEGKIPKKNKFFVAIFYLNMRITQLILKPIIKKYFFKNCVNCDYIPGIKSLYGNIYAENVFLCDGDFIDYSPIYIGNNTTISFDCKFITAHHDFNNYEKIITDPIWIGKNVFIGTGSLILQGVTIGDNSVIAAGSVVTKDVEPFSIVGGNPAKLIRKISNI